MSATREFGGGGRSVPGNKVAASIIWGIGCIMTYAAIDQMTDWTPEALFGLTLAIQIVLTAGQSPVWSGRGTLISYALLAVDTVINFGGAMAILVNVDQMGSAMALTATFTGWQGIWPMWIKGVLGLAAAAIVAGLPEFLWKLD